MASGSPDCVQDRRGEVVELMGCSRQVLAELATQPQWKDTEVGSVAGGKVSAVCFERPLGLA